MPFCKLAARPVCCDAYVSLHIALSAADCSLSLAGEARSASHTGMANPVVQQGLKELNTRCSAVEIAISLLDMHPLSPRPPPQAPSQLLNKDGTQTMSTQQ